MTGRARWLTHDTLPDLTCRAVYYPHSTDDLADLLGAMQQLADPVNWEQDGDQTPEDTAYQWELALAQTIARESCMNVGIVVWFAGLVADVNWLLCDGALYDTIDFPLLAEVLGDLYGGEYGTNFRVPDIRDRFIWGQHEEGTPPTGIGSTGGEVEHTLAANEMPAHVHSQPSHVHAVAPHTHPTTVGTLPIVAAPGALPADGPSIPGATGPDAGQNTSSAGAEDTGSTGGGEAHNNMPPYIALRAYIVAR